ncbi:hypothetical protein A2U01_0079926, partial [Trifolium medium]|nr:hypothetical protein [Trifolium medium]
MVGSLPVQGLPNWDHTHLRTRTPADDLMEAWHGRNEAPK